MSAYVSPRNLQLEDEYRQMSANEYTSSGEYPERDRNNLESWREDNKSLIHEQTEEVQPTTSGGVGSSDGTTKRVVRKSFQSSKLNELAANISPPAAPTKLKYD